MATRKKEKQILIHTDRMILRFFQNFNPWPSKFGFYSIVPVGASACQLSSTIPEVMSSLSQSGKTVKQSSPISNQKSPPKIENDFKTIRTIWTSRSGTHSSIFSFGSSVPLTSSNENWPLIIFFGAMGTPCSFYEKKGLSDHFARHNLRLVVVESRGYGASSLDPQTCPNYNYEDIVNDDFPAVVKAIKEIFPSSEKNIVMGHSLGGQMGLISTAVWNSTAVEGEKIDRVILIASCLPYWNAFDFNFKIKILVLSVVGPLIARILGYYPGHRIGFGKKDSTGMIDDFAKSAIVGSYGSKFDLALENLRIPVHGFGTAGDVRCPPAGIKMLLAKCKHSNRTHLGGTDSVDFNTIVPEPHDTPTHFRWTHNGVEIDKLAIRVIPLIKKG